MNVTKDRPERRKLSWTRWLVPAVEVLWLVGAGGLLILNRLLVPVPVWVLVPITYRFYWLLPLLPLAGWAVVRRRPRRHAAALVGAAMWLFSSVVPFLPGRGDPGADGLRVMTWNVQRGYRGIDEVLAVIAGSRPDVVALQEASRPEPDRADLVSRLEDEHGLLCTFKPYYEHADSSGVALCVSPLITVNTVQRRTYHQRGKWSYLFAEVVIDGRTINVVVPHLVAFAISEADLGDQRRVMQRLTWASRWHHREVDELLRLVAGFEDPTVMAGDFNSAPGLAIHARLRARLVDAFAAAGRGRGSTFTFGLPIRIDYIYLSHEFESLWAEVGPKGASDHRAVLAVLRLPESEMEE